MLRKIIYLLSSISLVASLRCTPIDLTEPSGTHKYTGKAGSTCWSVWPKTGKSGYSVDVITFTFDKVNLNGLSLSVYQGGVSVDPGSAAKFVIDDTMYEGFPIVKRMVDSSGRAWIQADDSDLEISFELSYTSSGMNREPSWFLMFGVIVYFVVPLVLLFISYYILRPTGEDVLYEEFKFIFRRRMRFLFFVVFFIVVIILVFAFLSFPRST